MSEKFQGHPEASVASPGIGGRQRLKRLISRKDFILGLLCLTGAGVWDFTSYSLSRQSDTNNRQDDQSQITPEKAKSIMGDDFLGPDAARQTFGVSIDPINTPPIPFSEAELTRAKELNHYLILRSGRADDGTPLSIAKMLSRATWYFDNQPQLNRGFNAGYPHQSFYANEASKDRWALVSKDIIPSSEGKTYMEQTETLVSYLRDEVYAGIPSKSFMQALPEFEEAWKEYSSFENRKRPDPNNALATFADYIQEVLYKHRDWHRLGINQQFRHSAVELVHDILVYYKSRDARLLMDTSAWTQSRTDEGLIVAVQGYDANKTHKITMNIGGKPQLSGPIIPSSNLSSLDPNVRYQPFRNGVVLTR